MFKFFLLFLFPLHSFAVNYYVASNGNDASVGTSPAEAWHSIGKLNASFKLIEPGDSILFKRGDTFYGALIIKRSGYTGKPIVISAYGEGSKPIITGFTSIKTWKPGSNSVWEAFVPDAKATLNLVVKDNLIQQVGRYPNAGSENGGYLNYNSPGGSKDRRGAATISSGKTLTKNWTGAEIVIKKKRWNIERDTVTGQSGNTVQYRQPPAGNIYSGIAGFGFFFQRDPRTLDQPGEWYFDDKKKTLQMFFGIGTPLTSGIRISTIDTLIYIGSYTNITISDLAFEGANEAAVYSNYSSDCTISHCDFNFMGRDAITNWQTSDALVEYCTVNNALGSGIFIRNSGSGGYNNSTVQFCSVKNICQFPGMEIPGDAAGRAGITVTGGKGVTIQYNTIDSAGYAGIEWQGSDVLVYANVVSNCLNVRDDGGGIYSYVGNGSNPKQYSNRIIRKNIVINCIGASQGTNSAKSSARGIYCDEGSNHILIDSNTVAYCSGAGLYCNSVSDIEMSGNIIYKNGFAFSLQRFQNAPPIRNISIRNNYFLPYKANYANAQMDYPLLTLEGDLHAIGTIDNNYCFLETDMPFLFTTMNTGNTNYKELPKPWSYWKSDAGFDIHSTVFAGKKDKVRLEYNATPNTRTVSLDGNYTDIDGKAFYDKIILQPYTSKLFIANGR